MEPSTVRSAQAEGPKRRACDECRSRKLACSKEADGCSRCKRDGVRCNYSKQAPMGRPRKVKRPHVHVQDSPEEQQQQQQHPFIMPANDSAMDLDMDLDLAFWDINDINFLDLIGPDSSLGAMNPSTTQPVPAAPNKSQWKMDTHHLAHEIDFDHSPDPQPQPRAEEVSLEQAFTLLSADLPETLPALSPQASSSGSSSHPSPTSPPQICTCLSSLYLALDSLQHLPTDVRSAVHTARSASRAAHNTILCPICSTPPLDHAESLARNPPIASLQNMMMLGALLPSLSNAYKTILAMVDDEARAASEQNRKLVFDLASYGGLWGSLGEDGAPGDCGATDRVNGAVLEPAMWRLTLRALLKIDVYGMRECAAGGRGPGTELGDVGEGPVTGQGTAVFQPGLKDIIAMMEERSRVRHEQIDRLVAEGVLRFDDGGCGTEYVPLNNARGEKPTCFRIIDIAKRSMQGLVIP